MRTESAVRGFARRRGYIVRKSRRALSYDNQGEFMLVSDNCIVLGEHFDATLEDIQVYLRS